MDFDDVVPGDEVKNGRSGKWGRVIGFQRINGEVARIQVQLRLGPARWRDRATHWDPASIVMVEKAK